MREYIIDWDTGLVIDTFSKNNLREEIVRCRDCVFFISDVSTVDEYGEQIATGNLCEWTELWVKPDGYCAWAERRDA